MRHACKVDDNQPDIVKALRGIGCHVEHVHQLKDLFDILVGYRGKVFLIEIKDGSKPPSKTKLTDGELKCKTGFNRVGVEYHVIYSVEEAINLVTS